MTIPKWEWQRWEEAIIHEHRCQMTSQEIAQLVNRARAIRGLPPRNSRCVTNWGRSRGIEVCTLIAEDGDTVYTVPELCKLLQVGRKTLYRLCRNGLLAFTRGSRSEIRISLSDLNAAIERRPWIPRRWPTIEPLKPLIDSAWTWQKIKAARERHIIVHRLTGQSWQTQREASAALGIHPRKIQRTLKVPNAYLEARHR